MANVLFKQGLQSSLDGIRTGLKAKEGTFYLTTDTHRLYIGRITESTQTAEACDAVPVNQGVTFVETLSQLPTVTNDNKKQYAGQFYYVGRSNILCVYNGNGAQSGWVQINPNTDTKVEGISYEVTTENNVATIKTVITSTRPDGQSNGATVEDTFSIKGAGGAQVTSDGKAVTVTGEQYEIKVSDANNNVATVKLESASGSDNSEIKIKGTGTTKISKDKDNNLVIDGTANQVTEVNAEFGDGNSGDTGFYFKVTDNRASADDTLDPTIAVGKDTSLSDNIVHFKNGVATLPVYTKTDVDNLLKALNGLTFRGTIDSNVVPTTDVQIGDMYKVTSQIITFPNPVKNATARKGDLLIAKGTEDANGYVTAATLEWEIIPSGDDTVYTYKGEAVTHGIKFTDQLLNEVAKFELEAGGKITLTDTADGSSNKVTIAHEKLAAAVTPAKSTNTVQGVAKRYDVTAITGIQLDDYGHIVGITQKTYPLFDSNGNVSAVGAQIETTQSGEKYTSTVTTSVQTKQSNGLGAVSESGSYKVESSTLKISSTQATVDDEGVKNTKQAVMTIDMVWGTF